jgi:hypothetical protein
LKVREVRELDANHDEAHAALFGEDNGEDSTGTGGGGAEAVRAQAKCPDSLAVDSCNDLDARLENQRALEEQLLELSKQASKVEEARKCTVTSRPCVPRSTRSRGGGAFSNVEWSSRPCS